MIPRDAPAPRNDGSRLTVLLADDHHLIREVVKGYVRRLASNVTFLEASSYDEVMQIARTVAGPDCAPQIAILDLNMPGQSGQDRLGGLRKVCEALPSTAVVVFSGDDDAVTIAAALHTGAHGYVPKSVQGRSLLSALKLVMDGEIYVPPEAMRPAADKVPSAAEPATLEKLSKQERICLSLLVEGMSNKEIGRQMSLQEATVKMHLRNAYRKIGAANRVAAVRIATQQGIQKAAGIRLPADA